MQRRPVSTRTLGQCHLLKHVKSPEQGAHCAVGGRDRPKGGQFAVPWQQSWRCLAEASATASAAWQTQEFNLVWRPSTEEKEGALKAEKAEKAEPEPAKPVPECSEA